MTQRLWFCIIILLANIIQGITGFAGTILAMPPSLLLMGYPVAKPILNALALMAGILVFAGDYRKCRWQEVKRVLLVMVPGLLLGMGLKTFFAGSEQQLSAFLAVFVLFLAIHGMYGMIRKNGESCKKEKENRDKMKATDVLLLLGAGLVHGIFVSGGPLLIGYLTRQIKEKESFRVTISFIWIWLNSLIFVDDITQGYWNVELVKVLVITLPFFGVGMWIGGRLSKRMSQDVFMRLTYVLLLIAGIALLV